MRRALGPTSLAVALAMSTLLGCGGDEVNPDLPNVEIAFVRSYDDGTQQLRGFDPGQPDVALAPIEPFGTDLQSLRWSPDGDLLAFVRMREVDDLEVSELHLLDTQLGETRLLTDGRSPDWSPVGYSLGFLRGEIDSSALLVIDVDSGDERRIGTGWVDGFSWAPDGERLVVSGAWMELDSNRALYVVDVDTGEPTRIDPDPPNSNLSFDDVWPKWSPDGSTIAFTSLDRAEEDVFSRAYRMDPDGANLEQMPVFDDDIHGMIASSWSPTGEFLLYSYWYYDAISPGDNGVALMGMNWSAPGATSGVWSPDGSKLALVTSKGESRTRISLHSIDGELVEQTDATGPWSDSHPAWRQPTP